VKVSQRRSTEMSIVTKRIAKMTIRYNYTQATFIWVLVKIYFKIE